MSLRQVADERLMRWPLKAYKFGGGTLKAQRRRMTVHVQEQGSKLLGVSGADYPEPNSATVTTGQPAGSVSVRAAPLH